MNRDRQIMQSIANKQAQAREQYEKNKPLLSESKVDEKLTDYMHPHNEKEIKDEKKKDEE